MAFSRESTIWRYALTHAARGGTVRTTDLCERFDMSGPLASANLRQMRERGLLVGGPKLPRGPSDNAITEAGRRWLAEHGGPEDGAATFDFSALLRATRCSRSAA